MNKSLYAKPRPCFAVERPTKEQAKVIEDWALATGADFGESFDAYLDWKYYGVNKRGYTYWAILPDQFFNNILTFAEFAEIAVVEVAE